MHMSSKCAHSHQQSLDSYTILRALYEGVDLESHWLICKHSAQPLDIE